MLATICHVSVAAFTLLSIKYVWGETCQSHPLTRPLSSGSAAVDAGVPLSSDWPDPLRSEEKGKLDAGAVPYGSESLKVDRLGRLSF